LAQFAQRQSKTTGGRNKGVPGNGTANSNQRKVVIEGLLEDALLQLLGQLQPLLQLMVCRLH